MTKRDSSFADLESLRNLLGGSAWLVSTYDIYYVLKALSKYLLHLG